MIHNCVRCTVKIYKQKQQQQTSKKLIALSLIKTKKGQSRDMIFLRIFEIEFMFHFLCFFLFPSDYYDNKKRAETNVKQLNVL
jgi:hypothetical protein